MERRNTFKKVLPVSTSLGSRRTEGILIAQNIWPFKICAATYFDWTGYAVHQAFPYLFISFAFIL